MKPPKVDRRQSKYEVAVGVAPYEDQPHIQVGVMKRLEALGSFKPEPSEVSWPSIGSVAPDKAEQFAMAILRAVHEARNLDELHG